MMEEGENQTEEDGGGQKKWKGLIWKWAGNEMEKDNWTIPDKVL